MRTFQYGAALGALATLASCSPKNPYIWRPARRQVGAQPVDSETLRAAIDSDALLAHSRMLEDFAYRQPDPADRNRLTGGAGHNLTVEYVAGLLNATGYYDVELQPWSTFVPLGGNASFLANGVSQNASLFSFSASGNVTAPVVAVSNLGCAASDYPAEVAGAIALISRGTCEFGQKSALAGNAGAVGAAIYNNIPGGLNGTLGQPRALGPYVPTVGISQEAGLALVDVIAAGTEVTGALDVVSEIEFRSTNNVLAQTKGGNKNATLVVGAHSDSVAEGPGINDDGSGVVGILEVALQLANYTTTNAVRFGFWSGEEEGLLGSTFYVDSLSNASLAQIKLYLNFDMIASPNYFLGIYDGDGSSFNISGPPGSAEAERLFEEFFDSIGQNHTATEFDGRSDYGPFLDVNIAAGGLFTGAEGIKTEEEEALFGGEAGVAYDVNYHGAGDNVTNLNMEAFLINTQAIAHSVATYATSFESLNQTALARRSMSGTNFRRSLHAPRCSPSCFGGGMQRRDRFRSTKLGVMYG